MNFTFKLIFSVIFIFCMNYSFATDKNYLTQTIKLRFYTSEEIIPILKVYSGGNAEFHGQNDTLVIRSDSAFAEKIQQLVSQIDLPPETYQVKFISSSTPVQFNQTENLSTTHDQTSFQTISVQEGTWGTISTGYSIPMIHRQQNPDGTETQYIKYTNIMRRYFFKPYVFADQVYVEVRAEISNQSQPGHDIIQHGEIQSVVRGATGQWIEVTGAGNLATTQNAITYRSKPRNQGNLYLYIYVEPNNSH